MKASEIVPGKKLKILLISDPGGGKTEFIGTWPGLRIADCDIGTTTLVGRGFKARHPNIDLSKIVVERFQNDVDKHGIFKKADGFWRMLDQINKWEEDKECETIAIDSLTTAAEMAMHVGLEVNQANKRSQTISNSKQGAHRVMLPTQADFGSEMNIVEQLLDGLLTFDKNIIVAAHARNETSDTGSILSRGPLVTGNKLRAKIGKWFDEVWWLDVVGSGDQKKRVLYTESTNTLKCVKTRLGIPDKLENPTYEKIMAALNAA